MNNPNAHFFFFFFLSSTSVWGLSEVCRVLNTSFFLGHDMASSVWLSGCIVSPFLLHGDPGCFFSGEYSFWHTTFWGAAGLFAHFLSVLSGIGGIGEANSDLV